MHSTSKSFDWRLNGSYNDNATGQRRQPLQLDPHVPDDGPNVHPNDTGHAILAATFKSGYEAGSVATDRDDDGAGLRRSSTPPIVPLESTAT